MSLENASQPTQEATGSLSYKGSETHHQGSEESAFPFPHERTYVRTSSSIVGYLSRNDRGSRRGVYSLLDGRESHWSPSSLQPLTWEEARIWWLEQEQNKPASS